MPAALVNYEVRRKDKQFSSSSTSAEALVVRGVAPKAYHPSFDDDQLMKLCLLMILCLISDRFIIKILVGA